MNMPLPTLNDGISQPLSVNQVQSRSVYPQGPEYSMIQFQNLKNDNPQYPLPTIPLHLNIQQHSPQLDQTLFPRITNEDKISQPTVENNNLVVQYNGKHYIDVECVVKNKQLAYALCDRIVNKVVQPQPQSSQFNFPPYQSNETVQNQLLNDSDSLTNSILIGKHTRKETAYRWTPDRHLRFAVICLALGIKDCKPKHILQFYQAEDIDRCVISSHLQKLRNSLIKQYRLSTLDSVTNNLIPKELQQHEIIRQICSRWEDPHFDGYSRQEVQRFIKMLQI